MATVGNLYLAGDEEGSKTANNGATENINAVNVTNEVFVELIRTCSDNLVSQSETVVNTLAPISTVVFFTYVIFALAATVYIYFNVAKRSENISKQFKKIIDNIDEGNGDFTLRLENNIEDEIGWIVLDVNLLLNQLQNIMKLIKSDSEKMYSLNNIITKEVGVSNDNATSISATLEELSASMEEFSATVGEIANGTIGILDSSENKSDNAESGKDFIDETIIEDYDKFVNTADSYHADADRTEYILQEFHTFATNLAVVIKQMTEGTDGINISVEESAKAVASAATNTEHLVGAMSSIKNRVDNNYQISLELSDEVARFKEI